MLYGSRGDGETPVPCRQVSACPSSASERPAGSRRCASIGPRERPYRGRSRRERIPGFCSPPRLFVTCKQGGRLRAAKQTSEAKPSPRVTRGIPDHRFGEDEPEAGALLASPWVLQEPRPRSLAPNICVSQPPPPKKKNKIHEEERGREVSSAWECWEP